MYNKILIPKIFIINYINIDIIKLVLLYTIAETKSRRQLLCMDGIGAEAAPAFFKKFNR